MNIVPPAVRILPMNREKEFPQCKNIEDLQQRFFLDELPSREDCDYLLYTGLKAEQGTVILFQSNRNIIARAILSSKKRFPRPDSEGYEGSLLFERNSIRIFDPVPEAEIKKIWTNVKKLSQVKWQLNPENYITFEGILKNVICPMHKTFLHK